LALRPDMVWSPTHSLKEPTQATEHCKSTPTVTTDVLLLRTSC